MSDAKRRITITVDPAAADYAEQLVQAGRAGSVSDAFNQAIIAQRRREQHGVALLRQRAAQADPARVARLRAHVDRQARAHGFQVAAGD
ncbi:hypothetical protein GCM10009555_028170 [Acrocarpospora macrocephala]|uniref:CopG family transcriptional regulator n=1 Tax=Acrocarpospora macrocephala TaxID=150177 RepID=A0A5M3X5U2_9ACTN|nr:hypothetical protein [Acrocarpospora macrocephala]GES17057.1 hypothetical protein Amac_106550 [Acrocarpospora macrocephala]